MSAALPAHDGMGYAPSYTASVERLRGGLLWLTGLSGAFVFMEPSPYEVASLVTMVTFLVTGLALRPTIMPLLVLLLLYNIGFSIAVVPVLAREKALIWVLVSWYMGATAIFFAAMLARNTEERMTLLLKGYTAAAVIASVAAIVGYFRLVPGADLFLKFGRAQGTFNDPNVLGAFLVLPAVLALQRTLSGRFDEVLRGGMLLMLFTVALLLSFSRGAWAHFAVSAALLMALTFIISRSSRERMRLVLIAVLGLVTLTLFVLALLSVDKIADLFEARATLDQSYDTGHTGRFGRHILGMTMALEHPFGIGPMQFGKIFSEDPHNSYLNAFMAGGWLSGLSYATLTLVTLTMGFRYVFVATPWRRLYLVVYAVYIGVVGESFIIDTDHWRHYFLVLGLQWGLMAASWHYRAKLRAAAATQ